MDQVDLTYKMMHDHDVVEGEFSVDQINDLT
jgi:hypothetical protein